MEKAAGRFIVFLAAFLLLLAPVATPLVVWHPAYEITSGTFPDSLYIFSGNLTVNDTLNASRICLSGDCISGWGEVWGLWNYSSGSIYPRDLSWNVGIGTALPSKNLEVNGSVLVRDKINTPRIEFRTYDTANHYIAYSSAVDGPEISGWSGIRFLTQNGGTQEVMRITSSGNVGIGTTNPANRLAVAGSIETTVGSSGNLILGAPSVEAMRLGYEGGLGARIRVGGGFRTLYVVGSGANNGLYVRAGSSQTDDIFQVQDNGGTPLVVVDASGDVGIGTNSPVTMLDVNGSSRFIFWGGKYTRSYDKIIDIGPQSERVVTIDMGGTTDSHQRFGFIIEIVGQGYRFYAKYAIVGHISGGFTAYKLSSLRHSLQYVILGNVTGNSTAGTISFTLANLHLTTTNRVTLKITRFSNDADTNNVWSVNIGPERPASITYSDEPQMVLGDATGQPNDLILQPWGGNVGIGTASPSAELDVNGDVIIYHAQADGLVIQRNTMTKGKSGGGLFLTGGGYTSDKDWGGIFAGTWNDLGTYRTVSDAASGIVFRDGKIEFKTASGLAGDGSTFSFPTRMIIDASGNVGIGTTTPLERLHVGAGTDSSSLAATSLLVTEPGNVALSVRDSTNDIELFMGAYLNSGGGLIGTVTNHDLRFRTNNIDRVIITKGGNVGINVTNPAEKLDVNGYIKTTSGTDWLRVGTNEAGQYSEIRWGDDLVDRLRFYFDYWNGSTDDKEIMSLLPSGNVGIGTTNPTYKLDVNGTFRSASGSVVKHETNGDIIIEI